MDDSIVSVVIPVGPDAEHLGPCLDAVMGQQFPDKEVIVVCDPRAGALEWLPPGSEDFRVIRQRGPCEPGRLINSGMLAARGHVKILLRPHCVPMGKGWMAAMAAPFEDEDVGVVVGQCFQVGTAQTGLAPLLLESIDPQQRKSSGTGLRPQQVVSHQCDAYRASLLADLGYFETEELRSPGEAVDMSLKVADAGYRIVLSDAAAAAYNVPAAQRRLRGVLGKAIDYGYSDAVLDRLYELRWLNCGVFAAALFSLLLLPLGVLSLPAALVASMGLFAWGWFLSVRLPPIGWECPVAVTNFAVFVALVLAVRGDWWPSVLGKEVHPAIIRQWCWLAAVTASYLLMLVVAGLRCAMRGAARPTGLARSPALFPLGMAWWLLAGLGYLRGRFLPSAREG